MNDSSKIGQISAHFGKKAVLFTADNKKMTVKLRANLPNLAVGDYVTYQLLQNDVVISDIQPRNSLLKRGNKLVAANISQMLIVIAPEPNPSNELIDRYLIAAQFSNIKPVLVLNKSDLLGQNNQQLIEELLAIYQQLQIDIVQISTYAAQNLQSLDGLLSGHTSILVGQSGVGKTSIINYLLPNQTSKIGDLSSIKQGKHTTSSAQLFVLDKGAKLIDSPGVRSFELQNITKEQINMGFSEIYQISAKCKFRNCNHINEPNCAVKQAVMAGIIHPKRYQSYQKLLVL